MKLQNNLQTLIVPLLLVGAGLMSPSNGVDDRSHKTPGQLLATTLLVVAVFAIIYFVWHRLEIRERASNALNKFNKKNSSTSNW